MPNSSTESKRNPSWQRDELILALDLFFRHPPKTISQQHESVIELSGLLNALPIHDQRGSEGTFRNPNGVYMKLGNFLRFDSSYEGAGLSRGGKLEGEIWNEFASNRDELSKLATAIRSGYALTVDENTDSDEESAFPEGRVLYRLHKQRERSSKVVATKKEQALSSGCLACEICSFDFFQAYGQLGYGYLECHHTTPIAEYEINQKTRLQDLALVCANCHRMLHRRRPWLRPHDLRQLLK
jgi:5-methylcytosine-specific restriction protein A